jgi:branched-chain amino acid transport system substrate-binding protein
MFKTTFKIGFGIRALLGAALAVGAIACTKKNTEAPGAGETIKIGEVGSLTGDKATFGISTHQGIELAILEANEAGGVKGKKLEIVQYDNQGKPEEAATAMNRLITQDKVIAVLGEVASSISLAMAPLAQSNKIPMVTPSSTNPRVTQVGDYIFRVCFIDPFQGNVMATFAADHLKAKKVAILQDIKSDYSTGLAEFFAKKFKEKGGTIISTESYAEKDIDFKAQLTSIRSKKPDAIFVPGYYTEVALIARQAKELGINAPLMGGDGWDSPKLFEIGGKAVEGSYLSNHYSAEDTAEHVQNFIKKYKAKYGSIPDGLAAMGYDAAIVLIDAMKRAGELTPAAIRDALATTKDFKGVTGVITINSDRDAVKSAVVMKVDSGTFKYVTTINP